MKDLKPDVISALLSALTVVITLSTSGAFGQYSVLVGAAATVIVNAIRRRYGPQVAGAVVLYLSGFLLGTNAQAADPLPCPTVYYFTQDECPACWKYNPTWETSEAWFKGRATFVKLDINKPANQFLRKRYDVQSTPQVIVTDRVYWTRFRGGPTYRELLAAIQDPSMGQRVK